MTCPTHENLLEYLLDEASPPMLQGVADHMMDCPACRETVQSYSAIEQVLGAGALWDRDPVPPASAECLSANLLAAYVDARLLGSERLKVERHLAGCSACLDRSVALAQLLQSVLAKPTGVPAALQTKALALGK